MTELVQWFFVVWVLLPGAPTPIPLSIGPFVNQIQCDNMAHTVRTVTTDTHETYQPMCSEQRFKIEAN